MNSKPVFASSPRELLRIRESDVNVAIWSRPPPMAVRVGEMMRQGIQLDTSVVTDVRQPDRMLDVVTDVPDKEVADAILVDLAVLLPVFASALQVDRCRVSLQTVRTDACRKLHCDMVTLRLLCTYWGPATQWVADNHAQRKNLGRVDVDIDEANASVLRSAEHLRHAAPGDVLLLKGSRWPGFAGRGAIHRSPPLTATGSERLLLKIDPETEQC